MMGSTMGMDTIKSGTMGTGGDFVETSSIHNLTRPVTPVMTRQADVPIGLQHRYTNSRWFAITNAKTEGKCKWIYVSLCRRPITPVNGLMMSPQTPILLPANSMNINSVANLATIGEV